MAPPIRILAAPPSGAPVVDPLHADEPAAPAAPPPSAPAPAAEPVIHPAPASAVPRGSSAAPAAPASEDTASSRPIFPSRFGDFRRWHLLFGGGYQLGSQIHAEREPFSSAAASYQGIPLFLQPSVSLVDEPHYDFRAGLDIGLQFLSVPSNPGTTASSITGLNVGALAEGNYYFAPAFGLGANLSLGYLGLMSSNADVGAPYSATFDWGSEGGLYAGLQGYANFWNNAFRVGVAGRFVPSTFNLATAPGQPDLQIQVDPSLALFLAADVFRIIDNVSNAGRPLVAPRSGE